MAVRSLTQIPVFSWLPPSFSPQYSIKVYDKLGGTYSYDITDIIIEGEYTDGVTETIGNFTFTIDNSEETYTSLFKLGDTILIYMDYATTATTLRFEGILERISKSDNTLKISGRSYASFFIGTTITYAFDNRYADEVIYDLCSAASEYNYFGTNFATLDLTSSTTIVSINWYQRPFWECVLELCNRASYDCYIEGSGLYYIGATIHFFPQESKQNTTDAVVHDQNLIETGDFAPDLSTVKNRIIVYGAKIEDQQIIWTSEDSISIGLYGVKEEIINDSNIITVSQAEARADYELIIKKDPPIVGEVTSLGLPTLKPGEQVRISDPMNGLDPGYYSIQKFTHKFSNDEPMQTILTVQKEISTIPKILKKRITFETQATEMENPNELRYSWLFDFNTNSGVHSNTEITGGRLKTTTGNSTGTWISEVNALNSNATECELRVKGESLPGTSYYVSSDNGITWQSISLNTLLTLSPPGSNLKIKIVLNSESTQIDALSLLFK